MSSQSHSEESPAKRQRISGPESNEDNDAALNTKVDSTWNYKIFNDSVHGHIEVNKACLAIIDTPQFQRLRFIKQLGFCYYVYPGASHNRFEHSIGVYHLAAKMVRSLQSHQYGLSITKEDILCVEIAGLCHDLGHGPHSHMFDGKFIPQVAGNNDWTHEQASLNMFDYMIKQNGLMKPGGELSKHGLNETDITFIKELINGPLVKPENEEVWPYLGRGREKAFLYEIISNKRTGIDVDKWDYFARDCHHLGIVNNFDHNRFIKFARVLNVNGQLQICSRDKEIGNLYQMFYTRYILHRSAYQHKVACACEIMAVDALVKANDFLDIPSPNGQPMKLSDSIRDMGAYMNVTDNILWEIYTSQKPNLKPAKEIIQRLFCRDLYRCLDERSVSKELQNKINGPKDPPKKNHKVSVMNDLRDQMIQLSENVQAPPEEPEFKLTGSHFRLQIVYMDFGKEDKDPLKAMRYYSKCDPDKPKAGSTAGLLIPPKFTDNLIRVYSIVNRPGVCKVIEESFGKLCMEWEIDEQPASNGWEAEKIQTPEKKPHVQSPYFSAGRGMGTMSGDSQ